MWLEAHERWAYDDTTRVQTLRRLVCLCTRCHRTTHFGFAEVTGQGPQAHAHLRAVNSWSTADADAHIAMAARTWRARSAVDWSLDLSILTAAGVVPSPRTGRTHPSPHRERHPEPHRPSPPLGAPPMARTSTTKISARDRARAARAKLDADERDHQKLVEDGVVAYYEAEDAREADDVAAADTEVETAAATDPSTGPSALAS